MWKFVEKLSTEHMDGCCAGDHLKLTAAKCLSFLKNPMHFFTRFSPQGTHYFIFSRVEYKE